MQAQVVQKTHLHLLEEAMERLDSAPDHAQHATSRAEISQSWPEGLFQCSVAFGSRPTVMMSAHCIEQASISQVQRAGNEGDYMGTSVCEECSEEEEGGGGGGGGGGGLMTGVRPEEAVIAARAGELESITTGTELDWAEWEAEPVVGTDGFQNKKLRSHCGPPLTCNDA
ncbi:hypothetical protein INR49_015116 [Caranx melampygus]|nr:hypothetical protein INR49_015116 [Caranx melampygus]